MNNKRATKRALLTSIMALVMCVVMLVGTTFAWFTDTASTGVNKIQAGNLDIKVEYRTTADGNWQLLDNATDLFGTEDTRFEPGHTRVVELKITNAGNLALKYKIGMNVVSETAGINKAGNPYKLSNYLKVATTGIQQYNPADQISSLMERLIFQKGNFGMWTARDFANFELEYTSNGSVHVLQPGAAQILGIKVYMPESVGNEANAISTEKAASISFGLNVLATQYTTESDSYGTQYDKDATYPVIVSNQQQANDAITNATDKKVNISIASGQTITLDNDIANSSGSDNKARDITFVGDGSQTVDVITNAVSAEGGQLNYQRGSTFTFENMTIQAGEGNFDGVVCDELTYKNCTIKGKLTLYGKATFIDCTFENTMANQYSIWTWGGTDVTFEGCTFNTNGKAILLYGQATASNPTNLVVNNCTFNDRNNGTAGKAAIEIGNDYNATYTLTINDITVNGFANGQNTGSKLWANKNSMDAAHLTVTIDGSKIQ